MPSRTRCSGPLASIGLALYGQAESGHRQARRQLLYNRAYYLAESGLQEGLDRLWRGPMPVERELAIAGRNGFQRVYDLPERVIPREYLEAPTPSEDEFRQTLLLAIPIEEASAKVRTGPPKDDEADLELAIWAGVLPVTRTTAAPEAAPDLREGVAHPARHQLGARELGERGKHDALAPQSLDGSLDGRRVDDPVLGGPGAHNASSLVSSTLGVRPRRRFRPFSHPGSGDFRRSGRRPGRE